MKQSEQKKLDEKLLMHDFNYDNVHGQRYLSAKNMAEQYTKMENAVAVLSNMARDVSYICYGHLGSKMGLGHDNEEVESIWEKKILDRVHPDDATEKIAWELQFHSFIKQQPEDQRADYYLQHFLRMKDAEGIYHTLRHKIFYLDYDTNDNVLLVLCLYTIVNENHGVAGIVNSLDDTIVRASTVNTQGILSERECEILQMIRHGYASKHIADQLCISVNTVNNHRQNIMRKLHCQNTTEAVSVARKLGLLTAE